MAAWMILELGAADLGGAIGTAVSSGISLYDVTQKSDLTIRCRVSRNDYRRIRKLAARKGWSVRTVNHRGIFWKASALVRRPVLVVLTAMILLVSTLLPMKILKVEVEGNQRIPDNRILEAAEGSGIGFWADRRAVRSEKMKNALLGALPELQWAGVNTYGSLAVITVRERAPEAEQQSGFGVSSIVAARDGVILTADATRGSCLVNPGQAVRQGETLISGIMDLETAVRMTRAEGEVFAQTRRDLTIKTMEETLVRRSEGRRTEKYSLILGKKRINFYKDSGISDGSCVKMYSKYVLTLPGGFTLPVSLVKETVTECSLSAEPRSEDQVAHELAAFSQGYLNQLMVAGVIVDAQEELVLDGGWILSGRYECQEMIGRVKPEEIGVYNGKTN